MTFKLLIVDDNVDLCGLLAELVTREGYDVETCDGGAKAIEMLELKNDFDLVITDLLMPDIDGIELIKHINTMDRKPPIIAMSGGGITINSTDILDVVKSMTHAIIQKPVRIQEFISIVNGVLPSHKNL